MQSVNKMYLFLLPWCLHVWITSAVGGYGLRRICLHSIPATCDFLYGLSVTNRDKVIRRPEWWYQCQLFFFFFHSTVEINGTAGEDQYTQLENVDPSQGGRTVMVRSPGDCHKMTALYPCTGRVPCGNIATAARGPYDYPKSLQSSYEFFGPNDHLKSCVVRTINARPLCGARVGIVRCYMYLRRVYGLRDCDFF